MLVFRTLPPGMPGGHCGTACQRTPTAARTGNLRQHVAGQHQRADPVGRHRSSRACSPKCRRQPASVTGAARLLTTFDVVPGARCPACRACSCRMPNRRQPASYTRLRLKPAARPWPVRGLELPASLPPTSMPAANYLLLARAPLTERSRYRLSSFIGQRSAPTKPNRYCAPRLSLPTDVNPRTRALGESWRSIANSDEAIPAPGRDLLRNQNLTYTLLPPLLGRRQRRRVSSSIARRLLRHFASAFAVAMRARGVPTARRHGLPGAARFNAAVDGYLTVRQSDAHAWTEVC